MKRLVLVMFMYAGCGTVFAATVHYNWLVDGTNYAQTTCETGDDLILPTPAPTKYGYHFVGWLETAVYGSWSQSETPSPENPIEPNFTQFGNTVLRALGSEDNLIADTYDPQTNKITRRVGVMVLNGSENWATDTNSCWNLQSETRTPLQVLCTHFNWKDTMPALGTESRYGGVYASRWGLAFGARAMTAENATSTNFQNATDWKNWLGAQYMNGTPVTLYYPLVTPVEENLQ